METIGDRVRQARQLAKLTQEALAEKIGLTRQAISQLESKSGTKKSKFIHEIATTLNVSTDWLLTGDQREGALVASRSEHLTSSQEGNEQKIDRDLIRKIAAYLECYLAETGKDLSRHDKYKIVMEIYLSFGKRVDITKDFVGASAELLIT